MKKSVIKRRTQLLNKLTAADVLTSSDGRAIRELKLAELEYLWTAHLIDVGKAMRVSELEEV